MISFIYRHPLTSLFTGFLLHKYVSFKYPKQYEYLQMQCAYYSIYYFSKAQIFYLKIKPQIDEHLKPVLNLPWVKPILNHFSKPQEEDQDQKFKNGYLEFIQNGEVIHKTEFSNNITIQKENYDFIIYSRFDNTLKIMNKKILHDIPDINEGITMVKTDYKFMLSEVIIQDDSYKIDFYLQDEYNYYIAENIIETNVILYFLKTYHHDVFHKYSLSDIKNYRLKIVDDSINIREWEAEDTLIQFKKDNYRVIKEETIKVSNDLMMFQQDNQKVSNSMNFPLEDYDELPDLIPIDRSKSNSTICDDELPDLISVDDEDSDSDLPDLILMDENEENDSDLPDLV